MAAARRMPSPAQFLLLLVTFLSHPISDVIRWPDPAAGCYNGPASRLVMAVQYAASPSLVFDDDTATISFHEARAAARTDPGSDPRGRQAGAAAGRRRRPDDARHGED